MDIFAMFQTLREKHKIFAIKYGVCCMCSTDVLYHFEKVSIYFLSHEIFNY